LTLCGTIGVSLSEPTILVGSYPTGPTIARYER
jgi:hypothetical protein